MTVKIKCNVLIDNKVYSIDAEYFDKNCENYTMI